jgi:hypothetical protein
MWCRLDEHECVEDLMMHNARPAVMPAALCSYMSRGDLVLQTSIPASDKAAELTSKVSLHNVRIGVTPQALCSCMYLFMHVLITASCQGCTCVQLIQTLC